MPDRRTFLLGLAGLTACSSAPQVSAPSTTATPAPTSTTATPTPTSTATETTPIVPGIEPLDPASSDLTDASFDLGVASGDPTASTVILWSHARTSVDADLVWEIATDDTFATLIATGRITATPLLGDAAPTKVRAEGLPAAAALWYRFRASGAASPIGRTRTLPSTGDVTERAVLAVSSCQDRTTGRWAAHRDLAATDVDLVVWLGDYIYEQGARDLAGYIERYRTAKADPALQAAHAAHPWLIGTDDHEVVNDYDASVDPARAEAAMTAWAAYQPVDLTPGSPRWRAIAFGDLLEVCLLDTRAHADADTTLGADQWSWLTERATTSDASWLTVASPTISSGLFDHQQQPLLDYGWDQAPGERERLAALLDDRDAFVVSGDLHTSMTLELRADPLDPTSPTAAPEFMAPAISSAFPPDYAPLAPLLSLFNPQLLGIDPTNGWLLVEVTPDQVAATQRRVVDVADPDSAVLDGARFTVEAGDPAALPSL